MALALQSPTDGSTFSFDDDDRSLEDYALETQLTDVIFRGTGEDELIQPGDGNDIVGAGGGDDTIFGGDGTDRLIGGNGDDLVFGDSGNDTVRGADGSDFLFGGDGDDKVYGNTGEDVLLGGRGNDALFGGVGPDTFVFENLEMGSDTIFGFQSGEDQIDLLAYGLVAPEISFDVGASKTIITIADVEGEIVVRGLVTLDDLAY